MANSIYAEQVEIVNLELFNNIMSKLPAFTKDYFNELRTAGRSSRTVLGYARDILTFFEYIVSTTALSDGVDGFVGLDITALQTNDLERIKKVYIDRYMAYIMSYEGKDGTTRTNHESGRARKLSAIRGLYDYLYRSELISANPASLVKAPDIKSKPVDALDPGEVAQLLDDIENGVGLTKRTAAHHKNYATRDLAICTILLGTGLRVSELVGLNIADYNDRDGSLVVTRKGGDKDIVFCSEEVENALCLYLVERNKLTPKEGSEGALFLSSRRSRISVDAVEELVKKYSLASLGKDLHPHSYRATFATNLLEQTDGDVVVVAAALNHANIQTTKDHYLRDNIERKRAAMRGNKLRSE